MKIESEIPINSADIERESPLFITINNTSLGTLSIFSKMLSLNEYEKFELTFRYSLLNQIFLHEKEKSFEEIDKELYKLLQDDLNLIRIEPYKHLLKQLIEISTIKSEKQNSFTFENWVDYLFNCKELTQENLITWARAILKYNISYKKKALDILRGVDYPLENWTELDSMCTLHKLEDFRPIGEILQSI